MGAACPVSARILRLGTVSSPAVEVEDLVLTYGSIRAVDRLTFEVAAGSVTAVVGPNGAGKTTTMRMILDIIRADSGTIAWNGTANTAVPRSGFGYLPEERGLYPKMGVDEQLLFIAQLYGASKRDATTRLDEWLERLNITENRKKRVEQLSKGNQQKIQFLAAILHDPDILILDEPFSGLDPVNAEQMKGAFLEMRDRGKTIIFSTHQLDDAQELCEEVAIIHRGQLMISGEILDVRKSMGRQVVKFAAAGGEPLTWLDRIPGVSVARTREDYLELAVPDTDAAQDVLREAVKRGLAVTRFDISYPSLNDVFLGQVRGLPDSEPAVTREPELAAATV